MSNFLNKDPLDEPIKIFSRFKPTNKVSQHIEFPENSETTITSSLKSKT